MNYIAERDAAYAQLVAWVDAYTEEGCPCDPEPESDEPGAALIHDPNCPTGKALARPPAHGDAIAELLQHLKLARDLILYVGLIDNGANGTTDPTGTIDEGRVRTAEAVERIEAIIHKHES